MNTEEKLLSWLKKGRLLIEETKHLSPQLSSEIHNLLKELQAKQEPVAPRLYLIVNEGIHPIIEDLKKQYGEDIEYEVVTRENVKLDQEAEVARRVKEILPKYHGREIVIVPGGLPYLITVVYNTVYQITAKHPVYLQLDRDNNRYIEKTLDPRKLMF